MKQINKAIEMLKAGGMNTDEMREEGICSPSKRICQIKKGFTSLNIGTRKVKKENKLTGHVRWISEYFLVP